MRPVRLVLALALSASACGGPGDSGPKSGPTSGELFRPGGRWKGHASGGALCIVEAAGGTHVMSQPHGGKLDPALFSPDDTAVVTVSGGRVHLYALPSGASGPPLPQPLPEPPRPKHRRPTKAQVAEYMKKREAHLRSLAHLALFTPTGRVLVATADRISLYDPATGGLLGGGITTCDPRARFTDVFLDHDGSRLLSIEEATKGRLMGLWSLTSFQPLGRIEGAPPRAAFSPDGNWLVCFEACREPPVQVFNLAGLGPGGAGILSPAGHAPFTPDGRRLAMIDEKGIRFLDGGRSWFSPWLMTLSGAFVLGVCHRLIRRR
jgi:hypothetical protein